MVRGTDPEQTPRSKGVVIAWCVLATHVHGIKIDRRRVGIDCKPSGSDGTIGHESFHFGVAVGFLVEEKQLEGCEEKVREFGAAHSAPWCFFFFCTRSLVGVNRAMRVP